MPCLPNVSLSPETGLSESNISKIGGVHSPNAKKPLMMATIVEICECGAVPCLPHAGNRQKTGKWPDLEPPQSLATVNPCSNPCFIGFGMSHIEGQQFFPLESDNIPTLRVITWARNDS